MDIRDKSALEDFLKSILPEGTSFELVEETDEESEELEKEVPAKSEPEDKELEEFKRRLLGLPKPTTDQIGHACGGREPEPWIKDKEALHTPEVDKVIERLREENKRLKELIKKTSDVLKEDKGRLTRHPKRSLYGQNFNAQPLFHEIQPEVIKEPEPKLEIDPPAIPSAPEPKPADGEGVPETWDNPPPKPWPWYPMVGMILGLVLLWQFRFMRLAPASMLGFYKEERVI